MPISRTIRISPKSYPAVAEALLSGASAQLRNAATVGGNLLQRTRCGYFYDAASACNKREPGAGCDARGGENRLHAVLGWSEACIATHPSDFCVPLVALDAVVEIEGRTGRREIALEALHRLPGDTPERESVLEPGDLIVALRLPAEARGFVGACALSEGPRAHVLCLRRRVGRRGACGSNTARSARRGSRSAASPPNRGGPARRRRSWRAPRPTPPPSAARQTPHSLTQNRPATIGFKIELARRIIVRALTLAAAGTPARIPALPASPFSSVSGALHDA